MACSFQGVSLCYSFFCLLVSSVSGFRPDTKGTVEDTFLVVFLGSLVQSRCGEGGREGCCCKQITLACARSASATLGLPPLMARVASLPTLLRL